MSDFWCEKHGAWHGATECLVESGYYAAALPERDES